MKGDFTRDTFAPERHYATVRLQQGRVLLDADWNEQADIAGHRDETATSDTIGPCGAPMHDAAFGVVADLATVTDPAESARLAALLPAGLVAGDFLLTPGRFYVDGILCESEQYVPYTLQPDLPGLTPLDVTIADTRYLLYLDVWRRHITALDDPRLREAALGGPDTTTRLRTIWQVRALNAGTSALHCPDALAAYDEATAQSTGTLRAQAVRESTSDTPCIVPPSAGYTGLENQLYRVEIHDAGEGVDPTTAGGTSVTGFPAADQVEYTGGTWAVGDVVEIYRSDAPDDPMNGQVALVLAKQTVAGRKRLTLNRAIAAVAAEALPRLRKVGATFKWSRDNAIVVSPITSISGTDITVESLGVDSVLSFEPGQWVEITDLARDLSGETGVLAQVASVVPGSRVVRVHAAPDWPGDLTSVGAERGLRLRRWDGIGAVKYRTGAASPAWINLESGGQVAFDDGTYHAGDYWQIPARTASADARSGRVEWPTDSAGNATARRAFGIAHHYCRLGILTVQADGTLDWHDCRELFPPLTELTRLFHVGGDGQEAMPNHVLPRPLEAGVFNGATPIEGAVVRFRAEYAGRLEGSEATAPAGSATLDVPTVAGIAACWWLLDPATSHASQQVTATLLDDAGTDTEQVIHFNGNLSIADQVWYDPGSCGALAGQGTVQLAVSRLASLASRYLVDGGGQVVKPGEAIEPLVVRAASACGPVTDTRPRVHFKVTAGNGTLTGGGSEADVPLSSADGTASCSWTLDAITANQEVAATLVGNGVPTAEPTTVRFTATLITEGGGCCCIAVQPGRQGDDSEHNLEMAIRAALDRRVGCLCLLPGEHLLPGGMHIAGDGVVLRISGCGPATTIKLMRGPLVVERLAHFELRDLDVITEQVEAPLRIGRCATVVVTGCRLAVADRATTLLTLRGCDAVRIAASQLSAFTDLAIISPDVVARLELTPLSRFVTVADVSRFMETAPSAIAGAKKTVRNALGSNLVSIADSEAAAVDRAESLRVAAEAVGVAAPDVAAVAPALAAALIGRAIVLIDAGGNTVIENCELAGELRIHGDNGDFPRDDLGRITDARGRNVQVIGRGELRLHGSRLLRISLDGEAKRLFESSESLITAREMHARAVLSENHFALGESFLVAARAQVVANDFAAEGTVLEVLADQAVAVGNTGSTKSEVRLYAVPDVREAANTVSVSM